MRRLLTLISLMALLSPVAMDAQSMTNKERRYINSRVLTVVEEYERYATLYDEEAEYVFTNLFEHPGTPVICDMIGLAPYLTQIPVSEYIEHLKSDVATLTFTIRNVKKGEMTYSGGGWLIPVTFTKSISYIDNNGYAFSIDGFYGRDMNMVMNILYNQDTDLCRIVSIEGKIDSDRTFPEGRFLIVDKSHEQRVPEKHRKYIPALTVGGSQITYNDFDQAVLPAGAPRVNDIDVQVITDTLSKGPNYDVVGFSFDPRKARMKLRYGIAPFSAYSVGTSIPQIGHNSRAMEAGIDFGGMWSMGRSTKMGIFAGVGVSMSSLTLSLNKAIDYHYQTSVQIPESSLFKTYTVNYNISGASETLSFMDFYVPVYFEFEHRAGDHVLISWSVGAKGYYNFQTKWEGYSVEGKRTVSDDVGGSYDPVEIGEIDGFLSPVKYGREPYDITAMANLGIDINLAKKKFYLSLRGGYEYGIKTSYDNTSKGLPYYKEGLYYPVVYNPAAGGEDIALHSLISNVSYRRQAIWLEIGFKFKM